jgi:DNA repair protein RadA/Sms
MTLEGSRPLIVEIEALSTHTKFGYPKRSARGVSTGKLDLVIAILSKYTNAKIEEYDVFANIGRGLSVGEPGVDLALAAAVLSSRRSISLENTVFIGELSLTGSVKSVIGQQKRIDEARRLGFTRIIVGANTSGESSHKKATAEVRVITSIRELEQIVGKSSKKESEDTDNSDELLLLVA